MKMRKITETEYYEGTEPCVGFWIDDCNRYHCIVRYPAGKVVRNLWNVGRLALEWLKQFETEF